MDSMPLLTEEEQVLLQLARDAAERAYCPYSRFRVGAAVETDAGIFTGCNIENASYGLAICAERVALFSAIAAGARRIYRLAVSCRDAAEDAAAGTRMPCGACRQVIAEFMAGESSVLVDRAGRWRVDALLPNAFQLADRAFLERDRSPG